MSQQCNGRSFQNSLRLIHTLSSEVIRGWVKIFSKPWSVLFISSKKGLQHEASSIHPFMHVSSIAAMKSTRAKSTRKVSVRVARFQGKTDLPGFYGGPCTTQPYYAVGGGNSKVSKEVLSPTSTGPTKLKYLQNRRRKKIEPWLFMFVKELSGPSGF